MSDNEWVDGNEGEYREFDRLYSLQEALELFEREWNEARRKVMKSNAEWVSGAHEFGCKIVGLVDGCKSIADKKVLRVALAGMRDATSTNFPGMGGGCQLFLEPYLASILARHTPKLDDWKSGDPSALANQTLEAARMERNEVASAAAAPLRLQLLLDSYDKLAEGLHEQLTEMQKKLAISEAKLALFQILQDRIDEADEADEA